VTIHPEHPFADADSARDPVRRLRGRLGGAVSLWTTGGAGSPGAVDRAGLTVSSLLVAPGEPAHVLGLVDPDSDLALAVGSTGTAVVQLLQWRHRDVADVFAGAAPSPGGTFRSGTWQDSDWGPVLDGVSAWAGIRLTGAVVEVGWSQLLDGVVEHVELSPDGVPLEHRRGRYAAGASER
jgi:flavin reductase (DIM6/NTAB) family NADH-FMN oxidoreductase RutF